MKYTSAAKAIVVVPETGWTKEITDPNRTVGQSGQLCPDCGQETIRQAGCHVCVTPGCGFSKC